MKTIVMPTVSNPIDTFHIRTCHGMELFGELYATRRPGGRRVIVRETTSGAVLFDTDDCYDASNALNKLDQWLSRL